MPEAQTIDALTDPSPKRKPGRPKGSKDKKPRFNARRAAQQLAPTPKPVKRRDGGLKGLVSVEFRDAAAWERLDAYRDAQACEGRATAARELILAGLARWERLQARQALEAHPEPPLPLLQRVRLAWLVLIGRARVRP